MTNLLNEQARFLGFTIPTARLYPFQWNWDSAFVALGLATYDLDRAWTELEMLVSGQCDDGMIPSIVFRTDDQDYFPGPEIWQNHNGPVSGTGISQPPVLASVILSLVQRNPTVGCMKAAQLFEPVMRWTAQNRRQLFAQFTRGRQEENWNIGLHQMEVDPDLPAYTRKDIVHADASQRPSQLEYDKYLTIVKFGRDCGWNQEKLLKDGPFCVADPGLHFILLRANRDLLTLATLLGRSERERDEISSCIEAGKRASDYLWNDRVKAFCARDTRTGQFSDGFSNASALVFYADAGSSEQKEHTLAHIKRINQKTRFGLPSWDHDAKGFEGQRYWCGPLWCQMNYMISQGLAETGEAELAEKLRLDLRRVIELSGFYECFNPLSGQGCIGKDFSWTAALWLAWAGHDLPARQAS